MVFLRLSVRNRTVGLQTPYSLIQRVVRNPALAEELLQETFWQIWCNAGSYRGSGAVAAWLLQIARHRALDALRRQKVHALPSDYHLSATDSVIVAPSTRQTHLDQYEVQQALATLPEEQRTCLELSYFDGYSQREIAEHLNVAIGTVKSRMRLALEKLEHSLRSQGYP